MWSIQQAAEPGELSVAAELLGLEGVAAPPGRWPPCPFAQASRDGPRFQALLVRQGQRPAGALGFHRLSQGRGIVYLPLQLTPEALPPLARQSLAQQAAAVLEEQPGCLWQVLPGAEQAAGWRAWLFSLGFELLSSVQYWRYPVGTSSRRATGAPPGEVVPAAAFRPEELIQLVHRTYQHSRDFPELAGIDSPAEALASYYRTGTSGDRFWYVACTEGVPVGLLLLAQLAHQPKKQWELCYLGVEPRFRGRGWGRALLNHGLAEARSHGVQELLLGVDRRNEPALRLYRRLGFELFDQRELFCRLPTTAPATSPQPPA